MTTAACGLYVRGPTTGQRVLVAHPDVLRAHCALDDRFDPPAEAYLSAFAFPPDLPAYWQAHNGSEAGYAGPAGGDWVWVDIDRPDLAAALADTQRLVAALGRRYPALDGRLPVFFSGSKGFHVGVRLAHAPPPAAAFPAVCRRLAGAWGADAGVRIDEAVYSRTRLLRLPNSRHPKTGRHKVLVPPEDVLAVPLAGVLALAGHPVPFDLPEPAGPVPALAADWAAAEAAVTQEANARPTVPGKRAEVPEFLLEFIRLGVGEGERATTLFRCAAVLTEQGCPPALVRWLLTRPALDAGLPPVEVAHHLNGGIRAAAGRGGTNG